MTHTLVLNSDCTPLGLLPISALSWQDAMRALCLGTVTSIHNYDTWDIHSPGNVHAVPSVVMTSKYVKVRRNVAFTDSMIFLRDDYTCQYCGKRFPERSLTLDHVLPKSMGGGKTWGNIVAACGPCNNRRGNNQRLRPKNEPRRPTYYEMVEKRRSHPLVIPDMSWLPYLNWSDRVDIVPPLGMPGYRSAPTRALRNLVETPDWQK